MPLVVTRRLLVSIVLFSVLCGRSAAAQNVPSNIAFNLHNYAGKVVYVDFWASWCIPCRASFPFMADMTNEFGEDLAIVAINVDEDKNDALEFLASFEFDIPFEIVFDPNGELAAGFAIPGMPTSYLFDASGNQLLRHVGFRKSVSADLRRAIADAVIDLRLTRQ